MSAQNVQMGWLLMSELIIVLVWWFEKIIISLFLIAVHFGTDGFQAVFTIKIHHEIPPKLYDPGPKKGKWLLDCLKKQKATLLLYNSLEV